MPSHTLSQEEGASKADVIPSPFMREQTSGSPVLRLYHVGGEDEAHKEQEDHLERCGNHLGCEGFSGFGGAECSVCEEQSVQECCYADPIYAKPGRNFSATYSREAASERWPLR